MSTPITTYLFNYEPLYSDIIIKKTQHFVVKLKNKLNSLIKIYYYYQSVNKKINKMYISTRSKCKSHANIDWPKIYVIL